MTCKIEIIEGRSLKAMDINGKSYPYVVLHSHIDRIYLHFSSCLALFKYAQKVLLWKHPLETIGWLYAHLFAATHQSLVSLMPLFILSILLKNRWDV